MNTYIADYQENSSLEKWIAVLYVYLLPVRMIAPFAILRDILPGATVYFDFLLHILGLALLVLSPHKRDNTWHNTPESKVISSFVWLIIFLNCTSIIMAIIIQLVLGDHGGESAFSGIAGMLIYFSQYALMIIYNYRVLQLIDRDHLEKIWGRICWCLLFLGYWQVACMTLGGIFATLYDHFNFLGVMYQANMPKLCLTGAEGASAGSIISIFVMPYLFSNIIYKKNNKRYIIQILLWLIPLFFTKSSTAYILFSACCFVFILLFLYTNGFSKLFLLSLPVIVIVIVFMIFPDLLPDLAREQIEYLLLDKIGDQQNGSTATRMVPLLVNWGAFTEWPLLGVGNGLQGYFYEKYFPSWALYAVGTDATTFLELSRTSIGNGGIFIPSLLSGYGILGCGAIIATCAKYAKMINRKRAGLERWYFQFIIAAICIFITGFQGDFYGMYYLWFIFCLPLIPCKNQEVV